MNKPALKIALVHLGKVFFWSGISGVAPFVMAYISQDPKWMIFTPFVNAILYGAKRFLDESNKK